MCWWLEKGFWCNLGNLLHDRSYLTFGSAPHNSLHGHPSITPVRIFNEPHLEHIYARDEGTQGCCSHCGFPIANLAQEGSKNTRLQRRIITESG